MSDATIDWGDLAHRHADRIHAAARELAPGADAAWDAVQEAFLTAVRGGSPTGDPVAWLCGVARNHARHGFRSDARFRGMLDRLKLRRSAPLTPPDPTTSMTLAEALTRLPARHREAVVLKHVAGMTVPEVARAQGVSEAAARSRVRRGLARLRRILPAPVVVALLVREAAARGASPDVVLDEIAAAARTTPTSTTAAPTGLLKIAAIAATLLVLAAGTVLLVTGGSWFAPPPLADTDAPREAATDLDGGGSTGERIGETAREAAAADPTGADPRESVRGTVRDTKGAPIPGALVRAMAEMPSPAPRAPLAETRAGEDGTWSIGPIASATVRVLVSAPDRASVTRTAYRGIPCDLVLGPAGSLEGRVLQEEDGAPCADALVSVRRGDHVLTARTDDRGRYRVGDVGEGEYQLYVVPQGGPVAGSGVAVRIRAGAVTRQDVFVTSGLRLSGRVIDAGTGAPIAGARLGENYPDLGAVTDAEGRFVLRIREDGGLLVEADGYLRTRVPRLRLATEPELEVELTRAWHVSGEILDAEGRPVSGARVFVDRKFVWAVSSPTVLTGEDGSYAVSGEWPTTRIRLLAVAPGRGLGATEMLDLESRPVRPDTTIRLAPDGGIRGIVVDLAGRPVEGVVVLAGPVELRSHAPDPVTTGPDGTFAIEGLAAGSYRLAARPAFHEHDDYVWASSTVIEVVPGRVVRDVRIPYEAGSTIAGRVVDPEGRPVVDVDVTADAPSDGSEGSVSATTDAAGRFRLPGLAPATYRVYGPGRETLSVEAGTSDLEIVVGSWRKLEGRVRCVDPSRPVRSFTVHARAASEDTLHSGRADFSDGEGRFALPLPPGTYRLEATASGGRATPEGVVVTVPETGAMPTVEIVVEDGVVLEGTVRTPDGDPAAGTHVVAVSREDGDASWTDTDKSGAYRLAGLAPGRWVVTASHRPDLWVTTYRSISVAAGARKALDLVLRREAGALRLVVRDAPGAPVPGAWVRFLSPDRTPVGTWYTGMRRAWEARRRTEPTLEWPAYLGSLRRTDEEGRLDHPALIPGRVRLMVRTADDRAGETTVEIEEGAETAATVIVE